MQGASPWGKSSVKLLKCVTFIHSVSVKTRPLLNTAYHVKRAAFKTITAICSYISENARSELIDT